MRLAPLVRGDFLRVMTCIILCTRVTVLVHRRWLLALYVPKLSSVFTLVIVFMVNSTVL